MNILVTGASGFLATYLIPLLKKQNSRIVGLVRNGDSATILNLDCSYQSILSLTEHESTFDYVYHLASFIPYGHMQEKNQRLITDNVNLTAHLVLFYPEAKFILSSSVSIYGAPLSLPISKLSPFNQPDHYGLSKLASESIIMNLSRHSIIRFSSIIGPGMKSNSFVPLIAENAKRNKVIKLKGDGGRLQNYIDVRDAAQLCLLCAHDDVNCIVLGVSEKSFSNIQIAEVIQNLTKASIVFDGEDESPSFVYDKEYYFEKIGFATAYSINETLKDILDVIN